MIISEIKYDQYEEAKRLDAEYYLPEYIEVENLLKNLRLKLTLLEEVTNFIKKGIFYILAEEYKKEGIPFIRVSNIRPILLDYRGLVFISEEKNKKEKKTSLIAGDIVISKSGTLGNVSIIPPDMPICNISQDIIGISVKKKEINPYYLALFLNSPYGQTQLLRGKSQAVQGHLTLEFVRKIKVPLPSYDFQQTIESIVKEAYQKRNEANTKYKEAKKLLNRILGLEELRITKPKTFEVKFNDVEPTLRFDAEHYQPKYRQVKEFLRRSRYQVKRLQEVVEISNKKIDPSQEPTEYFNYIELANINPSTGEIEEYSQIIGHKAPSRARMLVKSGDVLVASLSGSLDNVGLIPIELDGAIASTGFFVIRSRNFLSEFLFLLFRTDLIKLQLEEKTAGAIMSAVPKTTFGDILIPLVPIEKQNTIANLINEFFKLHKEARELLNKAKKEVEDFIEKGS
ncbi:MAG: restriction endonuclease subunit S [Candidatus Heimdallarchaeaceae archaeon]